jgi:sensor histidine kinase regulating citrate/malate metabolism
MINKNEQERVLEYTKQIESKLEQTAAYSMTGNIAIDSIINYKLTQAKERKVDVDVEIVLPENIAVKEDDIIVILGNILDNAIEAVELLEKDKFINLTVGYEKGVMFIHIKNSYDSLVNVSGGKLLTRKKEKNMHGIGLQSVNNVIEKYNGLMELEYSDSEFSVDILLYV